MSRHTRRSLSLPARMAAAGVDRVFVAEATTLARGYGSQRLTNSRLWSDNMVLRTRADLSDALLREAMEALGMAVDDLDEWVACGDSLAKAGFNMDGTADCAERARATLAKLKAHLEGEKE